MVLAHRYAREATNCHKAQEGVDKIDDPHSEISKTFKNFGTSVAFDEERGQPWKAKDKDDCNGHDRYHYQSLKVVQSAKHAVVTVKFEELHRLCNERKRTQKRKGEREGMQGQTHTHKHTIKMKRPASLLTMNPPRQTDDDTRVVPGKQRIARPT